MLLEIGRMVGHAMRYIEEKAVLAMNDDFAGAVCVYAYAPERNVSTALPPNFPLQS